MAALTGAPKEVVAIDGKTLRRSGEKKSAKAAIHIVSAFAARQRLVLGQVKVADKANEIVAIRNCLISSAIEGAMVTLDAIGCQRAIAQKSSTKRPITCWRSKAIRGLFAREHRRAKTDRLDTELLKRTFVGWLRGERDHCKTAGIPSLREEDAKRPSRERESLVGEQSRLVNRMKATLIRLGIRGFNLKLRHAEQRLEALRTPEGEPIPPNTLTELKRDMQRRRFICDQIRSIEQERLERLERTPDTEPHAMVRLLARITGIGIETADLLVHELLLRNMRDRRAVARYGGLTGSPDRSGGTNREKGMARSGNARVRRGMIQLAWRFLLFQKNSALAQWYRRRAR